MSEMKSSLAEVHRRRIQSSRLFENFEKYYKEREFVKASEFIWGSINSISYAIGILYHKKLGRHREIVAFMKDIGKDEPKVIDRIRAAEVLHSNFYHGFMSEELFEDHVRKAIELRIWLIKLLDEKTTHPS